MAEAITLRVLTPEGLALEEEAVSVIAPGELGYLGMLRNHAPLVTTLQAGTLSWRRPDGARHMVRLRGGVLEIVRNQLTILTDTIARPEILERE